MNFKQTLWRLFRKNFCSVLFFLLSLLISTHLLSLEYGISANAENSVPITKFFVISERCSGSNYINSLMSKNFQICDQPIGHKHFPPWYDLPPEHFSGNPQYYTFNDVEEFLFIVIFRNPYDWVRSFHQNPWHADRSLWKIPFSKFIREPWKINVRDPVMNEQRKFSSWVDLNPDNGLPFENVFALRTAKIKNMLRIKEKAPNVYFVNYETVRDHPIEVLEEIKSLFALTLNPYYEPVIYRKGVEVLGEYKPKTYGSISLEDLIFINSQLDVSVEEEIGYRLVCDPQLIE